MFLKGAIIFFCFLASQAKSLESEQSQVIISKLQAENKALNETLEYILQHLQNVEMQLTNHQMEIDLLQQSTTELANEIQSNSEDIEKVQDRHLEDLHYIDGRFNALINDIINQSSAIQDLSSQHLMDFESINSQMEQINQAPLGSILAWVPSPQKKMEHLELPEGTPLKIRN